MLSVQEGGVPPDLDLQLSDRSNRHFRIISSSPILSYSSKVSISISPPPFFPSPIPIPISHPKAYRPNPSNSAPAYPSTLPLILIHTLTPTLTPYPPSPYLSHPRWNPASLVSPRTLQVSKFQTLNPFRYVVQKRTAIIIPS